MLTNCAQFIQKNYPEFTLYLYVKVKSKEGLEENRAFFRFVVQKGGFCVENEFFHMSISKITGSILMFLSSNITVGEIEKFTPKAMKPISEMLPL